MYGIAETGVLFEHAAQEVVATVAELAWSELDLVDPPALLESVRGANEEFGVVGVPAGHLLR